MVSSISFGNDCTNSQFNFDFFEFIIDDFKLKSSNNNDSTNRLPKLPKNMLEIPWKGIGLEFKIKMAKVGWAQVFSQTEYNEPELADFCGICGNLLHFKIANKQIECTLCNGRFHTSSNIDLKSN